MQAFIAILLACFALSVVDAEKPKFMRERAVQLYNECKAKTGATESETDIIDNLMVPTTQAGKCLVECMLTARGVLKNGKLDLEASKKMSDEILANNPAKAAEVVKTVEECSKINVDGLDKCSAAVAFYACSKHLDE